MDDSKTFCEQLTIRYPTLGRALWEPDPGGLYNAVQVGDVGFIRHGYFTCLFNALSPRDRPSDYPPESDPHFPHYLRRLQPRTSNHIRASTDHRRDFRSKDVTNASREPNIGALGYRILVSSQNSSRLLHSSLDPTMTHRLHSHAPGGKALYYIFLFQQSGRTLSHSEILGNGYSKISITA